MSTRARIGVLKKDGTVESIMLYQDAYPDYAGGMLARYYTDEKKIADLLALGNLFALASSPQKCKAEQNSTFQTFNSVASYINKSQGDLLDYLYIYVDGEWKYMEMNL